MKIKSGIRRAIVFLLIASLVIIPNVPYVHAGTLEPNNVIKAEFLDSNAQKKLHNPKWIRIENNSDVTEYTPTLSSPFELMLNFDLHMNNNSIAADQNINHGDEVTITLLKNVKIDQTKNFPLEIELKKDSTTENVILGHGKVMAQGTDTVLNIKFDGDASVFTTQTDASNPIKAQVIIYTKMGEEYQELKTNEHRIFKIMDKEYFFNGSRIIKKDDSKTINVVKTPSWNQYEKIISWTVTAEKKYGGNFDGCVFEDDLKDAGEYVEGSFKVNNVAVTEGFSKTGSVIKYVFPSGITSMQTITFQTEVKKEEFDKATDTSYPSWGYLTKSNEAIVRDADGKENKSGKVNQTVFRQAIKKMPITPDETKWKDVNKKSFDWQITVNQEEETLQNVVIKDTLEEYLSFKKSSDNKFKAKLKVGDDGSETEIEMQEGSEVVEREVNGVKVSKTLKTYTYTIPGTVSKRIYLTIPTQTTREKLIEVFGKGEPKKVVSTLKLGNNASVRWDGMDEGKYFKFDGYKYGENGQYSEYGQYSHKVLPPSTTNLITKQAYNEDGTLVEAGKEGNILWGDAKKDGLKWVITVNKDSLDLKNLKIDEVLPKGLKIEENASNSVMYVKTGEIDDLTTLFADTNRVNVTKKAGTENTYTYERAELTEQLTIGVKALLDEGALLAANGINAPEKAKKKEIILGNTAGFTADGIARTEVTSRYKVNTRVVKKIAHDESGNLETNWDNPNGKKVNWTININESKQRLKNVYLFELMPQFLDVKTNAAGNPVATLEIEGQAPQEIELVKITPQVYKDERGDLEESQLQNRQIYKYFVGVLDAKSAKLTIETTIDATKIGTETIRNIKDIKNIVEIHYQKIIDTIGGVSGEEPWYSEKNIGGFGILPSDDEGGEGKLEKTGKFNLDKKGVDWTINVTFDRDTNPTNYKLYDFMPLQENIGAISDLKVGDASIWDMIGVGDKPSDAVLSAVVAAGASSRQEIVEDGVAVNPNENVKRKLYPVLNDENEKVGYLLEISGFKMLHNGANNSTNYEVTYTTKVKDEEETYKNTAVLIHPSKAEVKITATANRIKNSEDPAAKRYLVKNMLESSAVAEFDKAGNPATEVANRIVAASAIDKTLAYSYDDNSIIYRIVVNESGKIALDEGLGNTEISDKLPEGWVFDTFKNGKKFMVFAALGASGNIQAIGTKRFYRTAESKI